MSVPAGKRKTSSMQFIETARKLRVHTIKVAAKKIPKAYTFVLSQDLVRLANDIHNDVKMANSVFPKDEYEYQKRRDYLIDARCKLQALCSSVEVTHDIVRLSEHSLLKFGEYIDEELRLISGVLKKDTKDLKRMQDKSKKQLNTDYKTRLRAI